MAVNIYHSAELEIACDPTNPHHCIPEVPGNCRAVLDIGGGAGQTLIALDLPPNTDAWCMDPEPVALALGRTWTRRVRFCCGVAEALPFADGTFDFAFSRVALPYAHIPDALREIHRVLRPQGRVWLMLHPLGQTLRELRAVCVQRNARAVLGRLCVLVNGAALHCTGRLPPYRVRESWQSPAGMRRLLEAAGFTAVTVQSSPWLVVSALRAEGACRMRGKGG